MRGIYLRDILLPNDYDGRAPRRSADDIKQILSRIIPIDPGLIVKQKLGFSVCFQDENYVNYIFKREIFNKLQEEQLLAQLSHDTEVNRVIYILNAPDTIYNKPDAHLLTAIEYSNNVTLLRLDKFYSNLSRKRYIKLTLDNKKTRDDLIAIGKIHVFNAELPVRGKFFRITQR